MEQTLATPRLDRRSARTRQALREALAAEIEATGDLSQVTVTAVTERAGITRRTFYSHYRDIPDLVACVEDQVIHELAAMAHEIAQVNLDDLEDAIQHFRPCPGSVEALDHIKKDGVVLAALLGEGGDPAFAEKLKAMVRSAVESRAAEGFTVPADAPFVSTVLDYYLTFVISAEVGVLVRWLTSGMQESTPIMARMMTALMFVRPGDLYGRPIDVDVPSRSAVMQAVWKELIHG